MSPLGAVVTMEGQRYRVVAAATPSGWWLVPHPLGGRSVRAAVRKGEWRRAREFRAA